LSSCCGGSLNCGSFFLFCCSPAATGALFVLADQAAIFLHNAKGVKKFGPQAFWERHFFFFSGESLSEMRISLQEGCNF
jgi:hypothetical protein